MLNTRVWRVLGMSMVVWCVVMLLAARPVNAGTIINVSSTLDVVDGSDGKCTLREAIVAVNTQSASGGATGECPAGTGGDTINVPGGVGTYLLATRSLSITKDVRLAGTGAEAAVVDGNGATTADRALDIGPNAHVSIDQIYFEHGQIAGDGGGIRSFGWLTLTNLTVANNKASGYGGGIAVLGSGQLVLNSVYLVSNHADVGGALIYTGGPAPEEWDNVTAEYNTANFAGALNLSPGGLLTMRHTVLYQNEAAVTSGGMQSAGSIALEDSTVLSNRTGGAGAGINAQGLLTVTNSVIAQNTLSTTSGFGGGIKFAGNLLSLDHVAMVSNTATFGGAIDNGAQPNAQVRLNAVTISGNSVLSSGGGIYNNPGPGTSVNLRNVTLSGNTTSATALSGNYGGAIYHAAGAMTLLNTTIADSYAGFFNVGASVYVTNGAFMDAQNSIIAISIGYTCLGTVTSLGHNLDQSANYCGFHALGDVSGQSPKLGPLQYNGGRFLPNSDSIKTRALLAGSPAIDTGDNTNCPVVDERDFARPIDGDHNGSKICDMGAFEAGPQLFLPLIRR